MRVCIKHLAKAVMTLEDKREGTEYDLCHQCKDEFVKMILVDFIPEPKEEVKRGRKRTVSPAN